MKHGLSSNVTYHQRNPNYIEDIIFVMITICTSSASRTCVFYALAQKVAISALINSSLLRQYGALINVSVFINRRRPLFWVWQLSVSARVKFWHSMVVVRCWSELTARECDWLNTVTWHTPPKGKNSWSSYSPRHIITNKEAWVSDLATWPLNSRQSLNL